MVREYEDGEETGVFCPRCHNHTLVVDGEGEFCTVQDCDYEYSQQEIEFDAATAKWEEREGR